MRKAFVGTAILLVGIAIVCQTCVERCWAATPTGRSVSASAAAQNKKRITVSAGTRILIRMVDSIDSTKQKKGDRFTATLETNLQAEATVVAPRGTKLYGRLAEASSAGRMSGSSELTLELTDIVINGTAHPLLTSTYEVKGKGEGGSTAKKVFGGAGLGGSSAALLEEERERALAQLPVRPVEPQSLPPRRDSNCKFPVKPYLSFAFSNPCRYRSLAASQITKGVFAIDKNLFSR